MRISIKITVNSEKHELWIKANHTSLDVLRNELQLTGTKDGCGSGKCGCCTVLFNGKPVNACLLLAAEADGSDIETIEGLATPEKPHPLQTAFVEKGAVQCGFCTPGTIMTAKGLMDVNPQPSEAQIKQALVGNLCRCTGYKKIIEAIQHCNEPAAS